MNYKYYRDLKHNYLVVKNEEQSLRENEYQMKILESGRLSGLLPCDVRNVNGEQYLYYDMGSMQSLRDRYTSRGMNRAQQLQLFSDMKEMLEGLSEYLLGEEGVVFDIDSIFVDMSTSRHSFMFCPVAAKESGFETFAEQLLDLTSSEDDEAATAIYELCEYASGRGVMTMEGIEKLLKNSEKTTAATPTPASVSIRDPEPFLYEGDREAMEDEEDEDQEEESRGFFAIRKHDNLGLKRADKRLAAKVQLLFAILFTAILAAMVYIRMNFVLTQQENYMSMGVMAVSVICGAMCLVRGLRGIKGKIEPTSAMGRAQEMISEELEEPEEDEYDYDYEEPVTPGFYKTPLKITAAGNSEDCSDNRTIVLDMDNEPKGELSLYSRNLDKTVRIALDRLPLTIGKMEGCVDKVIKDISVSRIHCRIVRDEDSGRLALIDLNSTNGTFKNGLRLQPREKNYIDEGDEVRIGRICFDCR
ncbi:FHA domain-containing protein [Butyrivibrio sp. DSM 10294]|uniref:DUF6382 domain-containing protein n=1 Tax=Butyrivibrio sp. DSM 10294 TaxID=2972457 RepID=UPI00234FA5DE|nr:DUF6382 domain-containing protein [Butyrivibrio sp. DSM 10294]MDC7292182.1 FHA domain-containing protein [Butyrivibrio sp. DSM 10294]